MILDPRYEEVRRRAREVAETVIAPNASRADREERFPMENIRALGEAGLLGLEYPTTYGGGGMDCLAGTLVVEEVSRACAATGTVLEVLTHLVSFLVYEYGTERQRRTYLPPIFRGEALASFALTEPCCGSDAGAIRTRAVEDGDSFVLNGSKIFITNGSLADFLVVFAVTDPEKGKKGISAFIVERDTPGLTVIRDEDKMGIRASATTQLAFEDARVPKSQMLGERGQGFRMALAALDVGRIGISAVGLGTIQAALDHAMRWAMTREQFGRPIIDFQAIRWKIAEMAVALEAGRQLTYHAAQLKDRGLPFTKEAAIAKLYTSTQAMNAATEAIQILGGYGYLTDHQVERLYRDAKLLEIGEGTSEIQKIVISRALYREYQNLLEAQKS